jgi:hypothetical protein
MKVRATQMMQYKLRRLKAGKVFILDSPDDFAEHCMEKVGDDAMDIHPSEYNPPPYIPPSYAKKKYENSMEFAKKSKAEKKSSKKKESSEESEELI